MAWSYLLTFDSKEPFCAWVVSPLSDRVFSFVCPSYDYSLEVRDKDWLYILFLGCKFLNGSPAVPDVKKCKEEAD